MLPLAVLPVLVLRVRWVENDGTVVAEYSCSTVMQQSYDNSWCGSRQWYGSGMAVVWHRYASGMAVVWHQYGSGGIWPWCMAVVVYGCCGVWLWWCTAVLAYSGSGVWQWYGSRMAVVLQPYSTGTAVVWQCFARLNRGQEVGTRGPILQQHKARAHPKPRDYLLGHTLTSALRCLSEGRLSCPVSAVPGGLFETLPPPAHLP